MSRTQVEMIEIDIRGRGIKDSLVLQAMAEVPRYEFVPLEYQEQAYEDHPLPIGEEQTISQPYIVALMAELLALQGKGKVLEIGTGCGYQTAVLARIAQEVYTVEILQGLAVRARETLTRLGYQGIQYRTGDGSLGWPEDVLFDGIIVSAAAAQVPPRLVAQLRQGARLVMPLGPTDAQRLIVGVKKDRGLVIEEKCDVRFVPLLM